MLIPTVVESTSRGERAYDIYARHSGRTLDEVAHDIERDNYMTAEQALAWGLIDQVISRHAQAVSAAA